jgi:hypothetical protein
MLAAACLLMSPFIVFLRHHRYSLWHPEVFACLAVLVAAGVVAGLLMESIGRYTRPVVLSFLITLTADIQMTRPDRVVFLALIFVVSLFVTFLLRNHLTRAGTVIITIVFASTFFSPLGPDLYTREVMESPGDLEPPERSLLHIVLDGQIGVEGIPVEFDSDGMYAEGLRDMYMDHGFQVYGRVFTRFYRTRDTMSKLLNFDTRGYRFRLHGDKAEGFYLARNEYFDVMRTRGYRIHVYQTEFSEYCGENAGSNGVTGCVTERGGAVSIIEGSAMAVADKVRVIFGVYSRLSVILLDMRVPPARLWPLSAFQMLERVRDDVVEAEPGSLFFVHLMLPHSPYAYFADCRARDDPWTWLDETIERTPGKGERVRNTPSTRALRYPQYLEQVSCTQEKLRELFNDLEESGVIAGMDILVHSEHGSRISLGLPDASAFGDALTDQDYVDLFSTFFAYRGRGTAAYDRRLLPIGPLFEAIIKNGEVPAGVDWVGQPIVYYKGRRPPRERMPDFSRELRPYKTGR